MAFLDPAFNPIFLWLLNLSPFWGLVVLALVISILVTLVYKYFTDQGEMKKLKEQQKEFQQRMKELRSNPEEMMKVQKEAMKANMGYMKHSFKPMLITMIPVLLIFGWMAGHLSYEPLFPGETYTVTAFFKEGVVGTAKLITDNTTLLISPAEQNISKEGVTWGLKSEEGEHLLKFKSGEIEQNKTVIITQKMNTAEAITLYQHSDLERVQINYKELKPLGTLSIFGWHPGWVGLYIIFSLIFSLGLRKLFNLY
ncbi:MAG: EMC3/TMCO1 family protein [Candidatus Woesearchaeota archaeon]